MSYWKLKASNRTKLELKFRTHISNGLMWALFQSNQTGIEILMDTKPPT